MYTACGAQYLAILYLHNQPHLTRAASDYILGDVFCPKPNHSRLTHLLNGLIFWLLTSLIYVVMKYTVEDRKRISLLFGWLPGCATCKVIQELGASGNVPIKGPVLWSFILTT